MPDDLDVVLTWMTADLHDLNASAGAELAAARKVGERIASIDERVAALLGQPSVQTDSPVRRRLDPNTPALAASAWRDLRVEATRNLQARGVDPSLCDIDALLDTAEVAAIDRRFSGGFTIAARLDRYDIIFAIVAGLVGALDDFLVVRIPIDLPGRVPPVTGSPLTQALRDHAISSDNWLAQLATVPYDQVAGTGVAGIGPRTHRVQTVGHDPLIGLIVGTLDILRGSMTAISKTGEVTVLRDVSAPLSNPLLALARQVGHLLSDAPTKMGLPLPGWSLLMSAPFGDIDGQKINEAARQMYLRGYDSWHLLTMATTPAAIELVLRAYWGLRCQLDENFRDETEHEARIAASRRVSDHPRYRAMALVAHSVAVAADIAKLIAYGGDPLAINAAEWFAFVRAVLRWQQGRLLNPQDVLLRHVAANRFDLDTGWDQIATRTVPPPKAPWPQPTEVASALPHYG